MSNSSLATITKISPNRGNTINGVRYYNRTAKVDRLTPHHTAGVCSVEGLLNLFANPNRQASCNYVIGNDGRVGLCVPEDCRAWTSSSKANDNRAITFEVSNSSTGGNWPVSAAAFEALVKLCIDICRRHGKKKLLWIPDKTKALAYQPKADEMLLTMHQWFASTNCPGPYLGSKFPELAARVTAALNENKKDEDEDMTQEQFNKMANSWLVSLGNEPASDWAKAALNWGKANGLMNGDEKGNLMPKRPITREEFMAVMNRFYDKFVK